MYIVEMVHFQGYNLTINIFTENVSTEGNQITYRVWRTLVEIISESGIFIFFLQLNYLWVSSRKHACIILTPLNPTFIQYNWGLQGYTLLFVFQLKNIDCGNSLEPPRRGGSNEYPQYIF